MTLSDLILVLGQIEAKYGGDLPVIDDNENDVIDAEYNDDGGDAAVVISMA